MKFVCDRCGKKYATAGDPAPGKVYKLKCRSCGHLIVVKGQAGTMTGIPAVTDEEVASASPFLDLALTPAPTRLPEPVSGPGIQPLGVEPGQVNLPLPREVAMAADSAASSSRPELLGPAPGAAEERQAPLLDPALTPPPPDKDELADFAAAAAEAMDGPLAGADGQATGLGPFDGAGARSPGGDTFAAAARASLPDTWSGATPTAAPPEPRPAAPAPEPARPSPRKSVLRGVPLAVIGLGLLALTGIAAYALLGPGSAPPPVPPVAEAPRPAPEPPRTEGRPPVPEPEAAPAAPEPEAAPPPGPKVAEPRPAPRVRPPPPRPEPKVAEKRPVPPPAPPPAEPRTETRDVDLPDAAAALTQDVVNRVVGANRRAFSACIANAGASGVKLDGRRVALRITVNTNGTVTYPTLDDQSLNTTEMGQCLKSAARLMIFPKFKGDPFHHEVPLILGGG